MSTTATARRRNARRPRPLKIHSISGYATSNGTSDLLDSRFDRIKSTPEWQKIADSLSAKGYVFKVKDLSYARHVSHLETGWAAQDAVRVNAPEGTRGWASSMTGGGRHVTFGGSFEVTMPSGKVEDFAFEINGPLSYYRYVQRKALPIELVDVALYNFLEAAWDIYPDTWQGEGTSNVEAIERYLNKDEG